MRPFSAFVLFVTLVVAFPARAQQPTGLHYFAVEDLDARRVVQRGTTTERGITAGQLILAPGRRYRVWMLQAETLRAGDVTFTSGGAGASFRIPNVTLTRANPFDTDGDGLHDLGEFIVGTDASNPDTDGDGLSDGAEVRQGTNPLDGLLIATGIVGSAQTPGVAVHACALNDVVAIADSARGVSVFNVFNAMSPVLIARVDTPGTALHVACGVGVIAVADGRSGLALIDISDPPAAAVRHQVPFWTQTVVIGGTVAYAGSPTGNLAAVDVATGEILQQVSFDGPVEDLALAGDELFVLTNTSLFVFSTFVDGLEELGMIDVAGATSPLETGRKLFAGGGLAYAGFFTGYSVIDVGLELGSPQNPSLRGTPPRTQAAVHDIVSTGSGTILTTTSFAGEETLAVSLYDGSDPDDVTRFITSFDTPGASRGLAIYNGVAYVADSAEGMQIVNYLAYDTGTQPPAVALEASFSLDPPAAEEGKLVRVTANVSDDVQVRNVELYVDGALVATDGNFPFEHRFVTPTLDEQPSFRLRLRASDTGGNASFTPEIVVSLVPDATAPRVRRTLPRDGAILGGVATVAAFFDEPIDPSTLTRNELSLVEAGADGSFATGDDVPIGGGSFDYRDDVAAVFLSFPASLAPGRYRAAIAGTAADLAGNALGEPAIWEFSIYDPEGPDGDGDGLPDLVEELLGLNPAETDSDGDGTPDGDEDADGDGLSNRGEIILGNDPTNIDTDGDGIIDGDEDRDFDRLSDGEELRRGTDPLFYDSDGDGWSDGPEVEEGSDPLDPASVPRADDAVGAPAGAMVPDTAPSAPVGAMVPDSAPSAPVSVEVQTP